MEESKRKENNIHSKEQHKYSTFFCSTFASHTHIYIYLYLSSPSMNPPTSPTEAILFSTCFLCALKGSWGGGGSFCIERLSMNVPFDRYHTTELGGGGGGGEEEKDKSFISTQLEIHKMLYKKNCL